MGVRTEKGGRSRPSFDEVERVQPTEELTVARQADLQPWRHEEPWAGPIFPLEEEVLAELIALRVNELVHEVNKLP